MRKHSCTSLGNIYIDSYHTYSGKVCDLGIGLGSNEPLSFKLEKPAGESDALIINAGG